VEIAGNDPRAEAEAAGRFHEQDREVSARASATIEGLRRRLRAFIVSALVRDLCRDACIEVFQQG
jgi:hypothetical protein